MSNTPNGPKNKVPNTTWQDPYTKEEFLPPDLIAQLLRRFDYNVEADRLRAQGYKTFQEVEEELKVKIPRSRIGRIEAEGNYLPDGQDPPADCTGATLKGSVIKWVDPTNSQKILLHPDFIAAHVQAERRLAELKRQGFKTILEAAAEIGLTSPVVGDRAGRLENDASYGMDGLLPKGTPEERTEKGSSLKWTHPYNRHITVLHPEYVQAQKQVEEQFKALKKAGYKQIMTSAEHIGLEAATLRARVQKIEPEGDYLIDGTKPKGETGEEVVKGSTIRWIHPYNPQVVLLHPKYIEVHTLAEKEAQRLRKPAPVPSVAEVAAAGVASEMKQQGYKTTTEAAAAIGISVSALSARASKIKPDDDYLPDGTKPSKDSEASTVKGSTLRWIHPYKKNYTLLNPQYIQAQAAAEAKEKELLGKGYKTYSEAQEITGLDAKAILQSRARKIDDDKNYSLKGTPPIGDEPIVKGDELIWRHPYSTNVLIHPQLVEGWWDAEITKKELLEKNWPSLYDAASTMEANYMLIYRRASKIDTNVDYTTSGLPPQEGDATVKGNELVWQHPYSRDEGGGIFINPVLLNAWKTTDQHQKELRERGYKTYAEAAAATGIERSTLEARVSRIVLHDSAIIVQAAGDTITVPSSILVWKSPYGGGSLLHPDLVDHWQHTSGKVMRGAATEKIGDTGELLAEIQKKLDAQERGGEKLNDGRG